LTVGLTRCSKDLQELRTLAGKQVQAKERGRAKGLVVKWALATKYVLSEERVRSLGIKLDGHVVFLGAVLGSIGLANDKKTFTMVQKVRGLVEGVQRLPEQMDQLALANRQQIAVLESKVVEIAGFLKNLLPQRSMTSWSPVVRAGSIYGRK
jgi:hypothetical protein